MIQEAAPLPFLRDKKIANSHNNYGDMVLCCGVLRLGCFVFISLKLHKDECDDTPNTLLHYLFFDVFSRDAPGNAAGNSLGTVVAHIQY